jgi:hypothetical protein
VQAADHSCLFLKQGAHSLYEGIRFGFRPALSAVGTIARRFRRS